MTKRLVAVAGIAAVAFALLRIEAHWQGPTLLAFNSDSGVHVGDLFVLIPAAVIVVLVLRPRGR